MTANNTVTTTEDVSYTFEVSDFPFTGPGSSLTDVIITALTQPSGSILTLNGNAVPLNTQITEAEIAAGRLVFSQVNPPSYGTTGNNFASFTFEVVDNYGTSSAATMTIDVAPPPTDSWTGQAGNGQWTSANNWSNSNGAPSSSMDAVLPALNGNHYVVTSSSNVTVTELSSAANAALDITGGTFTVTNLAAAGAVNLSGGTLDMLGTTASTGSLTQSGGTLTEGGTLTVNGAMLLTGGTENGGGTVIADGGATLFNGQSQTITLDGQTLELAAASTTAVYPINGFYPDKLYLNNGSELVIESGVTFTDQMDGSINSNSGSAGSVINEGTYLKDGGGTTISVAFDNNGTASDLVSVDVQSGTLDLAGGGADTYTTYSGSGTIDFGSARTLDAHSSIGQTNAEFSSGTVTDNGGYDALSTNANGGTVNLDGTVTSLGATTVSNGTLNLNGASTDAASLTQSGGTLTEGGTLTVNGAMLLTGGTENGGGTVIADGEATLFNGQSQTITLDGQTLELAAASTTAVYPINGFYPDKLYLNNGSELVIESGVTFTDQMDGSINSNSGSAGSVINEGTYLKDGGGTTISVAFDNNGTASDSVSVDVQSGTLDLAGGGADTYTTYSGSGTIDFGSARTLDAHSSIGQTNAEFSSGTVTDNGGYDALSTNANGGTVNLDGTVTSLGATTVSNGTLNLNGASTDAASLTQSGGTLTEGGTLTVNGAMLLTGGTENGGGTVIADGEATLFNGQSQTITLDGQTLELAAASTTAVYPINGFYPDKLYLNNGSELVIESGVTFTDQMDGSINSNSGSAGSVINEGTYLKDGGGTTISVGFDNSGTIEVQGGTLSLSGALGNDSGGMIDVQSGTLNISGAQTNNGLLETTGGTADVTGTLSGSGQIDINGGGGDVTLSSIATTSTNTIDFLASGGVLTFGSSALTSSLDFLPAIGGFDSNDTITYQGTVTSASYDNGVLTLFDSSAAVAYLNLNGDYTGATFNTSTSSGLTQITVSDSAVSWINTNGDDWNDAADAAQNWSSGAIPNSVDDVTIPNSGATYTVTIANDGTTAYADSLTIDNAQTTVLDEGTLALTSALTVAAGMFELAGGTLTATSINVESPGSFVGYGTVSGPVSVMGTVEASNGLLDFADAVTGAGSFRIDAGTTLEFSNSVASGTMVTFEGGTGTLDLTQPKNFAGEIVGFTGTAPDANDSDVIDLAGINFNSGSFTHSYNSTSGVLTVSDGTNSASLTFVDFNGTFKLASDGNGGTEIYDPPAANSSNSSISLSQDQDHFIFRAGLESGDSMAQLHGGTDIYEPSGANSSSSSVSLSEDQDHFIFHPDLGSYNSTSQLHGDAAEDGHPTFGQARELLALINTETHSDTLGDFAHYNDGAADSSPGTAHWHHAWQHAAHLL